MSKRLVTIGIGAAMLVTALVVPVAAQDQATSDKRVGFSNNYAANSWRQAMLRSWDELDAAGRRRRRRRSGGRPHDRHRTTPRCSSSRSAT